MKKELEEFFEWQDKTRRKHRTMTWAEYKAWCRVGDSLDSPTSNDAFLGGLTILLDRDSTYFGVIDND